MKWMLFHQEDSVVGHTRKQKLAKYDRYLKKFEYSKALDAALHVSIIFVVSIVCDVTVSIVCIVSIVCDVRH